MLKSTQEGNNFKDSSARVCSILSDIGLTIFALTIFGFPPPNPIS